MIAEWEQSLRRQITKDKSLKLPELIRPVLLKELDWTASYLRTNGAYEAGPSSVKFVDKDGRSYQGFELTKLFFEQSYGDVVGPEVVGPRLPDIWARGGQLLITRRNLEITGTYLKTDLTLDEISDSYQITSRERIRQITTGTLRRLWVACSEETQSLYPVFFLPLTKPEPLQKRIEKSWVLGGLIAKIYEASQLGGSLQVGDLSRKTGIPASMISQKRKKLEKYGVNIPYIIEPNRYETTRQRLLSAQDPQSRQAVLDDDNNRVDKSLLNIDRKSGDPVLRSLYVLVQEAGFHPQAKDLKYFRWSLKAAGIPVKTIHTVLPSGKKQNYTVYLSIDRDLVIKTILADPNLAHLKGTSVI